MDTMNNQINLCPGCNTMKHLNEDGVCGRCEVEPSEVDTELQRLHRMRPELFMVSGAYEAITQAFAQAITQTEQRVRNELLEVFMRHIRMMRGMLSRHGKEVEGELSAVTNAQAELHLLENQVKSMMVSTTESEVQE